MNLRDLMRRLTADPVRPADLHPMIQDAEQWTVDLETVHEKAAEAQINAAEVERMLADWRADMEADSG